MDGSSRIWLDMAVAGCGLIWPGMAGLAGYGRMWPDMAEYCRMWLGLAGSGRVCMARYVRVEAGLAGCGWIWPVVAGCGRIWLDMAGYGRTWPDMIKFDRIDATDSRNRQRFSAKVCYKL